MPSIPDDALKAAVRVIRQTVPDILAVYLFGSGVDEEARTNRDVDLAVLAPHPLAVEDRFNLEQELSARLHQLVDLVDLRRASTVLRMQIISTGTYLLSQDDTQRETFETFVYADYARLNEERRDILKDIASHGRVYG